MITLGALYLLADVLGELVSGTRARDLLRESLLIGGWVALWHPLNALLYDRWPLRAEMRLYDRLSGMVVRVVSPPRPSPDSSEGPVLKAAGNKPPRS